MGKPNTKGRKSIAIKKTAAKPPKKVEPFKFDPPPVLGAIQLGERYKSPQNPDGVNDDTIRNWARLPGAPEQVSPGKWRVADFDRFVALMFEIGGPAAWKLHGADMTAKVAITGQVGPPPSYPPGDEQEPLTPDEARHISGTATTPNELMRLSQGQMIRAKMAEEIITRRLANQERKRRLIPRAEVEEWLFGHSQRAMAFKRQIVLELPPRLLGLDRPEMEARLRESLDELFRRIAALGDPISTAAGKPEAEAAAVAPAADAKKQ